MSTFILAFVIFFLVMIGMAVGVILNNRAIKGSCGGLNDIDGLEGACDICEVKEQCKRRRKMQRKALDHPGLITADVFVFSLIVQAHHEPKVRLHRPSKQ